MQWPKWIPWPHAWLRALVLSLAVSIAALLARPIFRIALVGTAIAQADWIFFLSLGLVGVLPGLVVWGLARLVPPVVREWIELKRLPWVEGLVAGVIWLGSLLIAAVAFLLFWPLEDFNPHDLDSLPLSLELWGWFWFVLVAYLYHLEFLIDKRRL